MHACMCTCLKLVCINFIMLPLLSFMVKIPLSALRKNTSSLSGTVAIPTNDQRFV